MLHLWDRKRLLWHNAARLRDSHFGWTQPGQLHVSVSLRLPRLFVCVCAQMSGRKCENVSTFQVLFDVSNQQRWDGAHRAGKAEIFVFFSFHFQFLTQSVSSCFPVLGVIRVEDVSRALLGLFPSWWLFQKAIWGSAFLANNYSCLECNPFISTDNRNTNHISLLYNSFILSIQSHEL